MRLPRIYYVPATTYYESLEKILKDAKIDSGVFDNERKNRRKDIFYFYNSSSEEENFRIGITKLDGVVRLVYECINQNKNTHEDNKLSSRILAEKITRIEKTKRDKVHPEDLFGAYCEEIRRAMDNYRAQLTIEQMLPKRYSKQD